MMFQFMVQISLIPAHWNCHLKPTLWCEFISIPIRCMTNFKLMSFQTLYFQPNPGKLKPLNEVNFLFSASKPTHQSSVSKPKIQHNNIAKAKAELKKPKVATRQDRRAGANKRRTGKRADNLMSRRGIQFDN